MDDDFDNDLSVIAFILQETAVQNELLSRSNLTPTRFNTLSPPQISILKYLRFLRDKAKCSRSSFIVALIYIDRLLENNNHITITPNTVHKLFLCSLILAATKFVTDLSYNNSTWANFGGVRTEELNILEKEFLFILHFSLVVSKDDYEKYENMLKEKSKIDFFKNV